MIGVNRLRKVIQTNPIKAAVFNTPPPLMGGIFLYGKIGSGKSTGMTSAAQKYHDHPDRRYKIIHAWGGDRMEQLYWCFPSRDLGYWKKVKQTLRLEKEGPKQYKVHLLYPMSKDLRKKLPKSDYVQSTVFTIPIKDVTLEDISLVIGNTANTHEYFWKEAQNAMKKESNGAHLLKHIDDMNGLNNALYRNFIKPLVDNRLLQSETCDYNLDLVEEIKDQETITVICLDFVDKEYRLFILGWILRKMAELLDKGKIPTKNIILLQEAAEFFRATDDSIMPDRYKIFRRYLAHYIRMGRRGMHLFMDAQSPSETKGMVDGSQDLTIFGKLTSEGDKESGTKQLYKDNLMTKKQIADLSTLNPGEYYIAESGKKVKKRYFLLPRTMYWKKGYGNFYDNIWRNLVGTWHDVGSVKEELENAYKEAKYAIIQAEKEKAEMARAKKIHAAEQRQKEKEERERKAHAERMKIKRAAESKEKTDLEIAKEEIDQVIEKKKEESIKTKKDIIINDKSKQKTEEEEEPSADIF